MNTITLTLEATLENIEKIKSIFDTSIDIKKVVAEAEETREAITPEAQKAGQEAIAEVTEPETIELKTATKEDVRAKAVELTKAGKQAELKDILQTFGASKLSALKEADYNKAYEMLVEAL